MGGTQGATAGPVTGTGPRKRLSRRPHKSAGKGAALGKNRWSFVAKPTGVSGRFFRRDMGSVSTGNTKGPGDNRKKTYGTVKYGIGALSL